MSAYRRRSGEVDVVSEAGLSGTLEQPKQGHTLFSARSAPDDNDDAIMRIRRREMQKVVPVAGREYTTSLTCKSENCLIGRVARKGLAKQGDIMAELLQQIAQVVGDVMIEQKLHSEAGAICLATSRSISPRWSS